MLKGFAVLGVVSLMATSFYAGRIWGICECTVIAEKSYKNRTYNSFYNTNRSEKGEN